MDSQYTSSDDDSDSGIPTSELKIDTEFYRQHQNGEYGADWNIDSFDGSNENIRDESVDTENFVSSPFFHNRMLNFAYQNQDSRNQNDDNLALNPHLHQRMSNLTNFVDPNRQMYDENENLLTPFVRERMLNFANQTVNQNEELRDQNDGNEMSVVQSQLREKMLDLANSVNCARAESGRFKQSISYIMQRMRINEINPNRNDLFPDPPRRTTTPNVNDNENSSSDSSDSSSSTSSSSRCSSPSPLDSDSSKSSFSPPNSLFWQTQRSEVCNNNINGLSSIRINYSDSDSDNDEQSSEKNLLDELSEIDVDDFLAVLADESDEGAHSSPSNGNVSKLNSNANNVEAKHEESSDNIIDMPTSIVSASDRANEPAIIKSESILHRMKDSVSECSLEKCSMRYEGVEPITFSDDDSDDKSEDQMQGDSNIFDLTHSDEE